MKKSNNPQVTATHEGKKPSIADSTRQAALETLGPSPSARQKSRIGKVSVTVWLDPEYKRGLLMLKVEEPSRTFESFVQEALDDLFTKRGSPGIPATPRKKPKGFVQGD